MFTLVVKAGTFAAKDLPARAAGPRHDPDGGPARPGHTKEDIMKRTGSAIWKGGIRDGGGTLSTESGALNGIAYSFARRFGDEKGTNPEELIAAAHAGCYTMQLSGVLGQDGIVADEIRTTAAISGEMEDGGFTIKASHLTVEATIPGADAAKFAEAAATAKRICPVSRLLNAEITLDAKLVG